MPSKSGFSKGATLIELVILIAVLGVMLPGIFTYFFSWRGGLADTRLQSLAAQLAQDLMEEIASKKWDENRTQGPVSNANKTASAALGPEGAEARTAGSNFDDMDDYDGLSESPPQDSQGNVLTSFPSFYRKAEVFYVNSSDLDTSVASTPPPNYKRVRVVVSWSGGSQIVELANVFSNR